MILEYLFSSLKNYNEIEKYNPDKVKLMLYKLDDVDCFIVKYSIDGENEENAKILSSIDEYVKEKFEPIVLENGSSSYYNQKLFPYINDFERKLRKLLYLKSVLNKSSESSQNIKNLETSSLGEIFDILFTDKNFIDNVKSNINKKTWNYTKKEIILTIQSISEETVWNDLMGEKSVTSLQESFIDVKNYRNDVMHAHNINTKSYNSSKKLFKEINKQLDNEIDNILITEDDTKDVNKQEFNDILSNAIALNYVDNYQELFQIGRMLNNKFDSIQILNKHNNISNTLNSYNKLLESFESDNNLKQILMKQQPLKIAIEQHAAALKKLNEDNPIMIALSNKESYKNILEKYNSVFRNITSNSSLQNIIEKHNNLLEDEEK